MSHWQYLPADLGLPLFLIGYGLLILLIRYWGSRLASGILSGDLDRTVDRFNRAVTVAQILIPTWFACGVFFLGWKQSVDLILGPIANWPLITPSTAIGLLPGLLAWMGLWWSQFPVDRALREHNLLFQLEWDLPVLAPPNFRDYFINKLRIQLLFTVVPLLMIMCLRDFGFLFIALVAQTHAGRNFGVRFPLTDLSESCLSVASVLVVLLLSPELLRRVLHTQKLPESQLRQSLSEICERAGIGCREILLWRTQNNTGNAAVMGLIPRVRYVMLSDLLLESMTDQQIQAVFAHELGHVKHRHLAWFVLFFFTFGYGLFAAASIVESHLRLNENWCNIFEFGSIFVCGGLLLAAYGFLSRWFERQADVYATRALRKPLESAHKNPGEVGAAIFASALERVAIVNNIPITARNWTHGSIYSRMKYIDRMGHDPEVAAQFDRTGRRCSWGLCC